MRGRSAGTAGSRNRRNGARNWRGVGGIAVFLALSLLSSGCGVGSGPVTLADSERPQGPKEAGGIPGVADKPLKLEIPSGTNITIRLLHSIGSQTAHPGDQFDAELDATINLHGYVAFPKSARVRGRVVEAKAAGRLKDPGFLRITIDAIQQPDSKWIDVSATSVSARGKPHGRRNATLVGGGAVAGALIGAVAGGGKGAAIGAASGAAAGTAGAYATGRQDVSFAAERKLYFSTTQTIVLSR